MITPALNTLGFPDWSLRQMVDFAHKHRVPAIEIRALENTVDLLSLAEFATPGAVRNADSLLQAAGVQVLSLNLGYHLSDELAPQADTIRRYAALAEAIGAPYLRFFSGGRPADRPDLGLVARGARQVLGLLAPFPVQMIVETHDALVRSEDILQLDAQLDGQLNLLWDIAHTANHGGEPWRETYTRLKPLIRYLHIKDTRRSAGRIENVLVGQGDLDVRSLLAFLAGQPENFITSLEWEKMWQPDLPSGEIAAQGFLEIVRGS